MPSVSGRALRWSLADLASHRRWIAAGLAGVAVLTGLTALRPKPVATETIWAAARNLPGGAPLAAADLARLRLPKTAVPAGALPARRPITGRLLGAPVRRGEPLTDVRLVSSALLEAAGAGADVAVPVRVADAAAAATVAHAGGRIDVLGSPLDTADTSSAGTAAHPPAPVATDLPVLAVPPADGSGDGSGIVVVAATDRQAAALAAAAATDRLDVAAAAG